MSYLPKLPKGAIPIKGDLYDYHNEIMSWERKNSVMLFFHRVSVAIFYRDYGKAIEAILVEIEALRREYFVFEGDVLVTTAGPRGPMPTLQEGKTMEAAKAAMDALLQQAVPAQIKLHRL